MEHEEAERPVAGGPPPQPSRRAFLISLGAGAAGITGYALWPALCRVVGQAADPRPRLHNSLVVGRDGDGYQTLATSPDEAPRFAVNRVGEAVLCRLDGRHTIAQVATAVARELHLTPGERLEAGIAEFVAQVGQAGLLVAPFYATLFERFDA